MIKLTRLGGEPFILNAELIQYVEARPDTFVTLTTGERIVVTESMDEVLRRAVTYQQAKQMIPPPASHRWDMSMPQRLGGQPTADSLGQTSGET